MDSGSIAKKMQGKGDRLCAVLYANSRPRLATYLPLAKAIMQEGHLCFLLHSTEATPDEEDLVGYEDLDIGFSSPAIMARMSGVDVFISSEVACNMAPPGAVTVGIQHSLPDQGLAFNYVKFLEYNPTLVSSMDYWVVALRQKAEHWKPANFAAAVGHVYPAALLQARRPTLDIVPGGYPKLDYLKHRITERNAEQYIIYCPTGKHLSYSSVAGHGRAIISSLLDRYPQYKVVFRPYPSRDKDELRHFATEFSGNERFRYDDSVTGISYFAEAAVLVTDRSSVAVTYSLASGKPSVFFEPHRHEPGKQSYRDEVGYRTFDLPQLLASVDDALANKESWKQRILSDRGQYLYHPDDPSAYLARSLPLFAARKGHAEWLSIERAPWLGMFNGGAITKIKAKNLKLLQRPDTTFIAPYVKEIEAFIGAVPQFEHPGPSFEFDGKTALRRAAPAVDGIRELTIELALCSDPAGERYSEANMAAGYSDDFPPMPLLAYPLSIYQQTRSRYRIVIAAVVEGHTATRSVPLEFDPGRWYKLRFTFDLERLGVLISVNDIVYSRLRNIRSDLGQLGTVFLGKGPLNRYWKGRLGYLDMVVKGHAGKSAELSIRPSRDA